MLYVEELIGPNTVNTVPPATLDAFRDHGKPRDSLEENIEDAGSVLAELEKSGISLDAITAELVKDGVKLFADAADKLYGAVAHKRASVLGGGIDRQQLKLGADLGKAVEKSTEEWRASAKIRRLWQQRQIGLDRRPTRTNGWAGSTAPASGRRRRLRGFRAAREGPEIHRRRRARHGRIEPRPRSAGGDVCAGSPASRNCTCLTPPIRHRSARWRPRSTSPDTVFIVSSKSGGTTEPNAMKDYFFDRVSKAIGADKAGHRFIAVTDPGSSLEKVAAKQGFARIFHGDPTIGGRYSVLSPFGLVPAAAAGIDVRSLIKHALSMVRSCGADVPPHENPGVQLGLAMGLAGLEGRDKVTISSSRKIADFGAWAEQLIAESTGKDGKGLIPIDGEPLGDAFALRQ